VLTAARSENLKTVETISVLANKAELNQDELLIAKCENVRTFLHVAKMQNDTEMLQKLWAWVKNRIEKLRRNNCYLPKTMMGKPRDILQHNVEVQKLLRQFSVGLRKRD
jgi:hypothetical protein